MKTIRLPPQNSYPEQIYFGMETYKIVYKKNLDCYAMTDSDTKTIVIKHGLNPRELLSTLIHEMLHVVEFELPLKIKHKTIRKLEKAILHILMDNFLGDKA